MRRETGSNIWKATVGDRKWRWSLETPAGSKSTAWTEMEASWHLGDPPLSWSGGSGPSMSTEWTNLRETEATVEVGLADSTRSVGKPRTWGSSRAGCVAGLGKHSLHSEGGEECLHNWTRSLRRQSRN